MAWTRREKVKPWSEYWDRSDGAVVGLVWEEQQHSNPNYPNCRMYSAWPPDAGEFNRLHKNDRRSKFHIPRKWGSAEAAMLAVDREFPIAQ